MKNTHEYASDQEVEYTISEEWKPIDEFPNYAVSNKGKVMNLKTGRILKHGSTPNGYAIVALCKGDGTKPKMITIHKLVATAFIPNPLNLPQINHIDEDRTNNDVVNLEWVSASKNIRHSIYQRSCKINQLSLDGEFIRQWESSHEIKRELGFDNGSIIKSCKGNKGYSHVGGFKWQYADPSQQRKYNHPVAALTMDGDLICEYKSAAEASRCLKICEQAIRYCLNGTFKSTNGLKFIYIDN